MKESMTVAGTMKLVSRGSSDLWPLGWRGGIL